MTNTVNEIKVSYKPNTDYIERYKVANSKDAFNLLYSLFDADQIFLREEFIIVYLNRRNRVLGYCKAFTGTSSSVLVDIKLILAIALKGMATSIILAHNHPSGNKMPSEADKSITKRMKAACEAVDIELIDHLIISPLEEYLSFADEGIL